VTIKTGSKATTVLVVVIVLAVLVCASLALAMMGDHMGSMGHAAVFCCFVLAVALTSLVLGRPHATLLVAPETSPHRVRTPARTVPPWPPDRVELGSLLI
jgi:hypothetical protein